MTVRPIAAGDVAALEAVLTEHWGSSRLVTRGRLYRARDCPGLVALDGEERLGFLTYRFDGDQCEILTLNSLRSGGGVGRRLVEAALGVADRNRSRRIWLVTTNDNLNAQGFWSHMGFSLARVHRDAMTAARQIKPEIPLRGEGGVPITDELEYERFLGNGETEGERS